MAATGRAGYLRIIEMVPSWACACVSKGCAQLQSFDRPTREEGKIVDKKSKFFCSLSSQEFLQAYAWYITVFEKELLTIFSV